MASYSLGTSGQRAFVDFGMDTKLLVAGRQEAEKRKAEFAKDMQRLVELLTQNIDLYGSSESLGDRKKAELYAKYLSGLEEPQNRYRIVQEFRKGEIPGLSAPRQAQMPPAWS